MSRTAVICLTLLSIGLPSVSAVDISADELQGMGLEARWSSQAVMDVTRDGVRFITNDEANVYVQSTAGMLTAFHGENGRRLWNAQVGRSDEPGMVAVSNSKSLILVNGPVVYGFNKFNGTPLFEFRLSGQPTAAPAVNEGAFFIPVSGGALYAYSLSVLEYRTRYGKLPETVTTPYLWRFICAEEISHPPVVGERAVSFASESKSLFSVETAGVNAGKTRCQLLLNKSATADLAIADNKGGSSVLMLTGENRIFSVDMMTGNTEWTYPMGRSMSQQPIVIGKYVYVVTSDGGLVKVDRDEFSPSWGRPVEFPAWQSPMYIGAGMADTEGDAGVEIKSLVEGSVAHVAGLRVGDVLKIVDGLNVNNIDAARNALAEIPPRVKRGVVAMRGEEELRLDIRIPPIKWETNGVSSITAIGRFGVYGIDTAGRLTGFDIETSAPIGRVNVQHYPIHHHNSATDQVYLASKTGEVICLREIGPTVSMPELTTVSDEATIKSVRVKYGEEIEPTGTVLMEVELPDGEVHEISSVHAGAVRQIYVKPGQVVRIGEPLVLIADDQFATYHQQPQQRPIDIELLDPDAAAPDENL